MRKLFLIPIILLLAIGAFSAPTTAQDPTVTIFDALNRIDGYDTFVSSLRISGLAPALDSNDAQYTVFVVPNGAFETFFSELGITREQFYADREAVTQVMRAHVLRNRWSEENLRNSSPISLRTVGGQLVPFAVDGGTGRLVLNNRAAITNGPFVNSNGLFYFVDNTISQSANVRVFVPTIAPTQAAVIPTLQIPGNALTPIAPPDVRTAGFIMGWMDAQPNFKIFSDAVRSAGLLELLGEPGPWTVLAPSDGAFRTYFTENGINEFAFRSDSTATRDILLRHIIQGRFESRVFADFPGLPVPITTLDGSVLTVDDTGAGDRFVYDGRRLTFSLGNTATVEFMDNFTRNGVIHYLDNVLLP